MREAQHLKVKRSAFRRSDRREVLCFQHPFLDSLGECGGDASKMGKSSKIRTESTQKYLAIWRSSVSWFHCRNMHGNQVMEVLKVKHELWD